MRAFFIIGFLLAFSSYGQDKFKIINSNHHHIRPDHEYRAAKHHTLNLDDTTAVEGPVLSITFIDDHSCKSVERLNHHYSFEDAYIPEGFPEHIEIRKATIVVVEFEDGFRMPVVKTPDGTYFSFLVESGYLTLDYKHIIDGKRETHIDALTVEVEKH